jgi:hypothetical protein
MIKMITMKTCQINKESNLWFELAIYRKSWVNGLDMGPYLDRRILFYTFEQKIFSSKERFIYQLIELNS